MDTPEHKFEAVKVTCAWCGVGGAKYFESFHDPIAIIMGFSIADWAAFFALIYSIMQIIMLMPRFFRTLRGWLHGIF